MPEDLQARGDFSHDEKIRIWKGRLYALATKRSARHRMVVLAKQKRRDDDHRKFVLGGAVEAEIADPVLTPQLAELIAGLLKRRVRETERFLFLDVFPDAKRPMRAKPASKAAAPPAAAEKA
jgi:hypothetical protein